MCIRDSVVSHHLTSIVLCCILISLAFSSQTRWWRTRANRLPGRSGADAARDDGAPWWLWGICLYALAATWAWFTPHMAAIVSYLSPSLTDGWQQLKQLMGLAPNGSTSGSRTLFAGSGSPMYEVVAALLLPAC